VGLKCTKTEVFESETAATLKTTFDSITALTDIWLGEKTLHRVVDLVTWRHQFSLVARGAEVVVTADEALVADSTESTLHTTVTTHTYHTHNRSVLWNYRSQVAKVPAKVS